MGRLIALITLTIVGLGCAATPARAHAVLLVTEPAADAVLDQPPTAIAITFNEPVRPVSFRLIDGEGDVVAEESAARVVDSRIELPIGEALPRGSYIVTWRVVSADSHPIGGSFRFAVGTVPGHGHLEESQPAAVDTSFWSVGLGFARALHIGGLLMAAGGIWFGRLVAADRQELQPLLGRIVAIAAVVGALPALVGVGLQGGLLLAAPPSALLDPSTWQAGLSTPIGRMLAASAIMLGIAVGLARRPFNGAASLAALLAVVPLGLAGHVSVAEPRWLTVPSLILHATLAAFWFGSLPPLLLALRLLPGREAAELLQRFSRIALMAVLVLATAGTTMAVIQLRSFSALWETSYGMVLATKLMLVAVLMLIALANRQRLAPALGADRPRAAPRLARNILLEIILIVAILSLTVLLGFNTPPRALQPAEGHDHLKATHHDHPPTIERQAAAAGMTATLVLSPGRPGLNSLSVNVKGADGSPLNPRQVEAHLASAEHGIEPLTRRLSADGDRFTLQTSDMALPGTWQIRIDVLVNHFDRPSFTFEVDIR